MQIFKYWAGALRRAAISGDIENGSLMAGQSVGMVKSEKSVNEIIDQLLSEMLCTMSKLPVAAYS